MTFAVESEDGRRASATPAHNVRQGAFPPVYRLQHQRQQCLHAWSSRRSVPDVGGFFFGKMRRMICGDNIQHPGMQTLPQPVLVLLSAYWRQDLHRVPMVEIVFGQEQIRRAGSR